MRKMGKSEPFENLIPWQKARDLSRAIYVVTRQVAFAVDFALSDQIQCAAASVMSNIAEGFHRPGGGESHQLFSTAKAYCGEGRSQLYVPLDVGYVDQVTFDRLMEQAEELACIPGGFRAAVDRQGRGRAR